MYVTEIIYGVKDGDAISPSVGWQSNGTEWLASDEWFQGPRH